MPPDSKPVDTDHDAVDTQHQQNSNELSSDPDGASFVREPQTRNKEQPKEQTPTNAYRSGRRFSAPGIFRETSRAIRSSWAQMTDSSLFSFVGATSTSSVRSIPPNEDEPQTAATGEALAQAVEAGSSSGLPKHNTDTVDGSDDAAVDRVTSTPTATGSGSIASYARPSKRAAQRRVSDPGRNIPREGSILVDGMGVGRKLHVGDEYAGPAQWVHEHWKKLKVGSLVIVNGERLVRIKDADRHNYGHYLYAFAATKRIYLVPSDEYDKHLLGEIQREDDRPPRRRY
jgi:hypothetical protein